jgi:hypothetical protein
MALGVLACNPDLTVPPCEYDPLAASKNAIETVAQTVRLKYRSAKQALDNRLYEARSEETQRAWPNRPDSRVIRAVALAWRHRRLSM